MTTPATEPRQRLFTPEQCIELGRCVHCEMHPVRQGHAPDCPTRAKNIARQQ